MTVLVLAEHDLGKLSASTARIVAAAEKLGPVHLLVAGQDVAAVADEAAKLAGVEKVLVADSAELARVGRCPGRHCGWLFYDRSGRRRWCSMASCGSREKMRRLYARQKCEQTDAR